MTDQERAVMQQALEALEAMTKHFGFARLGSSSLADTMKRGDAHVAMNNLRAALAEPAQQPEPVCKCDLRTRLVGDGCEVCNPELAAEFAQQPEPVQEPVAWNWMLDGRPYGQAYYGNPPDADIVERAAISGRTVRLLYTAPPQRKPVAWDGRCMLGHCNSPAGCENSGECRAVERKVRGETE